MKCHVSFLSALFWLLHVSLAVLLCTTTLLYYIREYYAPTLLFHRPTDEIEKPVCGSSTFTENLADIQIHETFSREQAAKLMKKEGAGIVQSVLTRETAADLRKYILKVNNQSGAGYYVHNPANRHHVAIDINIPIVRQAMKEVAEHPVMRPLIDDLLGPAASLVSLNAITNLYGAIDQSWHADCEGAESYPDHFVYEYGLGIALQDTTKEMGATGMCVEAGI
jgi:hypothetical protein